MIVTGASVALYKRQYMKIYQINNISPISNFQLPQDLYNHLLDTNCVLIRSHICILYATYLFKALVIDEIMSHSFPPFLILGRG